jgi:hypothetical protein
MPRVLTGAALLGAVVVAASPDARPPAPTARIRGASLGLFASDPGYDYGTMVRELAARGASDVLLVIPWTQSHRLAHDPGPGPDAPRERTIARTVAQARRAGLRVALMPIVRLRRPAPGRWRGTLDPPSPARWLTRYGASLERLATVAARGGAHRLVVGSELLSLEAHAEGWRALVRRVRRRFAGRVAYATNWDDLDVPFADALDEVGVSAYFPLARAGERPSVDTLAARWAAPLDRLGALGRATGRPVFLAEVGYPSREGAAAAPWRVDPAAPVSPASQARAFDAFCRSAAEDPRLSGYYVWNWFGFGGPSDGGYAPRGKPAAAVLERCFRRRSP